MLAVGPPACRGRDGDHGLSGIQIEGGQLEGAGGDFQIGGPSAVQSRDLPSQHAGVGPLSGIFPSGSIAPAAGEVLSGDEEIDCSLSRIAQPFVAGHLVGFTQHDRGLPVSVHARVAAGIAPQVAVFFLDGQEVLQPGGDLCLVFAHQVRLPAAQEGQEGQGGTARIALDLPRSATTALA